MPKTGDAPPGKLLKYTSYLFKNPKLTEEEFHSHWRDHHAKYALGPMKKHGVVRYTQYHCTEATRALLNPVVEGRRNNPNSKLKFELMPWDAIVEIWIKDFETWESMAMDPIFGNTIFEDESYLFDCSRSYTTMGWEEDMLIDNKIVQPGYNDSNKCHCGCKACGVGCLKE